VVGDAEQDSGPGPTTLFSASDDFFFERFKPVMMGSHFVNELSHIIMNTIFFLFLLSFEHVFIFFIEIKEDLKDGFRSQV
jgi:hypothetical protein